MNPGLETLMQIALLVFCFYLFWRCEALEADVKQIELDLHEQRAKKIE